MVVFTLTGLDTNVQLTQHPEYPAYTAPSITASYFLDLSMNTVDLSGVFFFSTTHPDESTLIFPVYVLDFSNDYEKTTNVPLLNYSQANSKILFNTSDTILFNGETPSGYDNTAYYWQDISNSIVSDPYSYLYGAFAFANSTNTGTGYIEYTLNTTSTTGGFVELKIKPNNRARKYFNVTSANNTIELAIVTTSNYSNIAENPIPVNTTQTFTIPVKNYSVLQLEEVVNSLLSSNYITAVYNEQSNKFTFSRLNYDFQIGGTSTIWLGFSSSTITDNISSTGSLVSNTEILDSAGSISIYVNNVLQTEWSNNLNMATGTIPLVYRYSFNDGEILKIDSNNLGGFAIYWVKIIHRDIIFNDDMAFRAESSYWPDISFSEGIISDCVKSDILTYSVPKTTKTIGPAWLAKNITGGYNNSDIFSNENDLVQNYIDLDKSKNIVVEGNTNVTANFGSYKYYRLVVTSVINTTAHGYPGIARLRPFDINGNIQVPDAASNSTNVLGVLRPATIGNSNNVFSTTNAVPTSTNTGAIGWISQGNMIYSGNMTHSNSTLIYTNNVLGEWMQWEYTNPISLSKLEIYLNGYSKTGDGNNGPHSTPAGLVLFGSNDLNNNWTQINAWSSGDNNITWKAWFDNITGYNTGEPAIYYTLSLANGIKDELTNKIDNAGNVENPLSNINNDVTNVSRELVNSMLDSSDPEVVQRVHTMIENNQISYPYQSHNVTVNASSNCIIDGEINPTLTLVRGLTYDFILNNYFISDPITYETTINIPLPNFQNSSSRRDLIFAYKIEQSTYDTISNQSSVTLDGIINEDWIHTTDILSGSFQFNAGRPYTMNIDVNSELVGSTAFRKNNYDTQNAGSNNFVVTRGNSITTLYVITQRHTSAEYNGWEQSVLENLGYTYLSDEDISANAFGGYTSDPDLIFGKVYKKVINAYSIGFNSIFRDNKFYLSNSSNELNTRTSFTPDLPIENVDSIYYQDGLSFYLDASTNHVNDDDYTQVAMPLFYSDVSYSTTDGYPITWENSNYRKIRFTVPFNAPDDLYYISQDINNNNFGGQINIITNTYLPWIPITFGHNDVLQFRLTYKADLITDSNGVALDSTGVKLGTNSVENQDYVARLTLKIPEILYDFTNHADNTAAFTYLNSTDLSHNLTTVYLDNPNNYAVENSTGIEYWNTSQTEAYIEILNFPGNSGTVTIKYGSYDSGGNQTSYVLITDNVNNSTRVHEISPSSGNSFNVIHTVNVPYNKNTKSIKIQEEWSAITLEKITIQQIF